MCSLPLHTRPTSERCTEEANGFDLLGFDPFYQQITLGVILLLAVGLDAWSRRLD